MMITLPGGFVLIVEGLLTKLLFGTIAAWAGLYATTSGVNCVRDWWGIVTTDSMPIDEAIIAGDPVKIQGRVRPTQPNDTVVSPILNKECVAYEYDINKVVRGSGQGRIDADTKYSPFIVSDGTATVLVDPDKESFSLDTTTRTPTTKQAIEDRTADERLEVEPSAYTSAVGEITKPIELREGTIDVGEKVTVVGKTTTIPEKATTDADSDADAVMTSEECRLTVMNNEPGNAALRKAGRGGLLLIVGAVLGLFAILIFTAAILDIVDWNSVVMLLRRVTG